MIADPLAYKQGFDDGYRLAKKVIMRRFQVALLWLMSGVMLLTAIFHWW